MTSDTSAAAPQTRFITCVICEASCGLRVELDPDGQSTLR